MLDHSRGGDDAFDLGSNHDARTTCYGDAGGNMSGHAIGGNDMFTMAGPQNNYVIYGDAGGDMSDHACGGNDVFKDNAAGGDATFYGDAGGNMSGHARGGKDTFQAGDESSTVFYGDAGGNMGDHAIGGDDKFIGSASAAYGTSLAYGDARTMFGNAQGGDDLLVGASYFTHFTDLLNMLIGDAQTMSGNARGGDDKLVGGNDPGPSHLAGTYESVLIGDAQTMSGGARGGNDTLISGTGNDDMWGDAQVMLGNARGGDDTFTFYANNGHDKIEDFGQGLKGSNWGTDHIDVSALGVCNFCQLDISAFNPSTHESTITFGSGNDVVVHSLIALRPQDFIFS
ncbi:calcium-binding protein [Rhodoblastus acidophilus]|uniref:Calcium-binding protein n=1 Tax=Candidatus Rhodoblastus alkanivorans TaxID=2954117 RepID=A0ABS9Z561_9HYPH|nr:calcium-binding protein [Candidatus Rhodoblastus alkanivorans]MCI4679860.1 calcium-binding protein [Candidatus Rhodoblastus alkanivorans]MCI4682737.1 calcium-binding protein [Candidatus Rhodoblastus alkanivorans]MDI4640044.1 calcium-binding protein [Rhodoblastus acidophilus]